MSFSKPKAPKEPQEAKVLRQRQITDLAKLDDEENRRIKSMLLARTGGRAFRAPSASRVTSNTRGSLINATGFAVPAMVATRGAIGGGGNARNPFKP